MLVTVDVAGMYYGRKVQVEEGASVRDALEAARKADKADRKAGEKVPQLNFAEDDRSPDPFLRSITVDHMVPAKSRQGLRTYPAGEYTFRSDGVAIGTRTDGTEGFIAVDQDGIATGKRFIQTWQYYVYDANGVDISRAAGSAETRTVVPFSRPEASNTLVDGGQIVLRLVTIFLEPSRRPSIKTAVEPGYEIKRAADDVTSAATN